MNLLHSSLRKLIICLLAYALTFLCFGIYHGLLQVMYRSGVLKAQEFLGINYYQGLTGHGFINAILLTLFFAVAFGHATISQVLGNVHLKLAAAGGGLLFTGASMILIAVFSGNASVLYTFYPPLKAHPVFYFGLVIMVVGSWLSFWSWIGPIYQWAKEHPGVKLPLPVLGVLATFVLWQIGTLPVSVEIIFLLIPWALHWVDSVNVVLSRTLFWFFGHPLVYFWLFPTYVMYYTVLPSVAGGKLYSDFAGRFAFLTFLMFSAPLGLHHQFSDPGISAEWKGVHTALTSIVALPSLLTAFTMAATLEYAASLKGGRGYFQWWTKLPYWDKENWLFPYYFCGLLTFIWGGASGVVNASYSVNQVVHNTAWVPAHFHSTVAGPVLLAILGMAQYLLIGLTGKRIWSRTVALIVPYCWMGGLFIMTAGLALGGLRGEPRRTNLGLTYLNPASANFRPEWVLDTHIALVGGIIMAIGLSLYMGNIFMTFVRMKSSAIEFKIPFSDVLHDEDVGAVRSIKPWIIGSIVMACFAYAPPIYEILKNPNPGAPPFKPQNPIAETNP